MKSTFGKKTALLALVILLVCAFAVLLCACDGKVSVDLSLTEEVYAGTVIGAKVDFRGEDAKVSSYYEKDYVLEVVRGDAVASVQDGLVSISPTARAGEQFTLRVTIDDISAQKTFTVAPSPVESVRLLCADTAQASDAIALSVEVSPADASAFTPYYAVVSGDGRIVGNLLKVNERADFGEIVLQAYVAGAASEQKRITITTVQTTAVSLSLSSEKALPGRTVSFTYEQEPVSSSYTPEFALESGADLATLNAEQCTLTIGADAPMGSEIVLAARCGYCEERVTLTVGYPNVTSIVAPRTGVVQPGAEKSFSYTLYPEDANPASVRISLIEGQAYVEWTGGASFTVLSNAPAGGEIVFLIEADDAYASVSYVISEKIITLLEIAPQGSVSYLRSGESLRFTHTAEPQTYSEGITYRVIEGANLVTINGDTLTVKDGADIGRVVVVAEGADGTLSNQVEVTVAGRYDRREYTSWSSVSLASSGENASVWMVLPSTMNSGCLTLIVPANVVDLVLEGKYDGTEQSAYKDFYLYFRNASSRTLTLWNFATVATQGLGGTVMDLGSAGTTEIVLKGQNRISADSPYLLDNSGEEMDGVWVNTNSQWPTQVRRAGKRGYVGTAGGTAISGHTLVFKGEGTLTASAGDGVNGTAGGNGADAAYESSVMIVSGSGGDGGHGGDSGVAIYADSVRFASGMVTALPGNAGMGAKGGTAGSLSALVGQDVAMTSGAAGKDGKDGVPYPAVYAKHVEGTNYTSSTGSVQSRSVLYGGTLPNLTEKLSRYYGITVLYGTAIQSISGYSMEQQTGYTELMQQSNFLMYTLSRMPRNALREASLRSEYPITVNLCKKIKASGKSTTILGLTSDHNKVWFSTFGTEIRGVYHSGYFNIMLHEFIHVFHYNFTSAATAFENALGSMNYGLSYGSSTSNDRVYGLSSRYDETNSCFLSSYSRKTVMEDAAETLSLVATFLTLEAPMQAGTRIREKYDLLVSAFAGEYETLASVQVGAGLFAYSHLLEQEEE